MRARPRRMTAILGASLLVGCPGAHAPTDGSDGASRTMPPTEAPLEATPAPEAAATDVGLQPAPPLELPAPERPVFVHIPGGEFGDGDHVAEFEIAQTETTVGQFRLCVDAGACTAPQQDDRWDNWGKADRGDHPVNSVDWAQASAYCSWAGGRLPTFDEWIWVATGRGEGRLYPWGTADPTCEVAVMDAGSGAGCGLEGTAPVGTRGAGASKDRVYDLAGNVQEWTASWYTPSEDARSVFGGSWWDGSAHLFNTETVVPVEPAVSLPTLGFRCVRDVG